MEQSQQNLFFKSEICSDMSSAMIGQAKTPTNQLMHKRTKFPFDTIHFLVKSKGWLAIAKLKSLSLFISPFEHCQILYLALVNDREMKSENGFSLAMAIQPLEYNSEIKLNSTDAQPYY